MQLRYNYRLYPSPVQRAALARAFGCARVVFNDALRLRQDAYAAGLPYVNDAEVSAPADGGEADPGAGVAGRGVRGYPPAGAGRPEHGGPELLRLAGRPAEGPEGLAGQRKGPKVEPPRFRSRNDRRQAVRFTANARFKILANGRLRLPKIGNVAARWSRDLPAAPSTVTVIRDAAGRYFASFVVATDLVMIRPTGVRLSANGSGQHLSGRVTDVAFRGRGYEHAIDVDGSTRLTGVFADVRAARGETRVPMIVVSPWARRGAVDHTYNDHVSILKFIEANWKLSPLASYSEDNLPNPAPDVYVPQNRPAIGDLMTMFKF